MSYQVLARKWRPKVFAELVGQEHVVNAICNGLTNNRLHHAYLFSGTRGVGKTTIARIFSKSLNCEKQIGANPCGKCDTCLDIEQGRYVDLLEIDAASRTKVEDTRDLLDNVQYKPTRGRYKVYLIDEVHMLSKHSFNALLKTLEEPPEHVKFLLATTDPQKLPITVLSRCLQFNLKSLSREQIQQQLNSILKQEQIPFTESALAPIAKAAQGSMRDALSLTDQAIAQSNGNIDSQVVAQMLGLLDKHSVLSLLQAVMIGDAQTVFEKISEIELQGADFTQLLRELISLLHQIALSQYVSEAAQIDTDIEEQIIDVAGKLTPEFVQLLYQIAIQGNKDLPYAADAKSGLEMVLLRMLAFNPVNKARQINDFESISEVETNEKNEQQELNAQQADILAQAEQLNTPLAQKKTIDESGTIDPLSQAHDEQEPSKQEPSKQERITQEYQENNAIGSTPEHQESISLVPNVKDHLALKLPSSLNESETTHNQQSNEEFDNDSEAMPAFTPESNVIEDVERDFRDSFENNSISEIEQSTNTNSQDSEAGLADEHLTPMERTVRLLALQESLQESSDSPESVGILNEKEDSTADISKAEEKQEEIFSHDDLNETDCHENSTELNPTFRDFSNSESENNNPTELFETEAEAAVEDDKTEGLNTSFGRSESVQASSQQLPAFLEDGTKVTLSAQLDKWSHLVDTMEINGLTRQMALHSVYEIEGVRVCLTLNQEYQHLVSESAKAQITQELKKLLNNQNIELEVKFGDVEDSPILIQRKINDRRLAFAKQQISEDKNVHQIQQLFDATFDEENINYR